MNLERIISQINNYLNQFDNSRLEDNPLKYVWKARFVIFKTEPESIDPPYFKISNTTELKELITKVFPLESPSRISNDIDEMVNRKSIDPSSEVYIIFYPA